METIKLINGVYKMAKGKLSTTITLTITIILAITVYSLEFNVF
jgi:hypothetical protein